MPARKRSGPEVPVAPLRRGEKKLRTRRLVLGAALVDFQEKKFQGPGTAEIARLAEVWHGAVFTVEPTKERLAVAAFSVEVRSVGRHAFARAFARHGAPADADTDAVASALLGF